MGSTKIDLANLCFATLYFVKLEQAGKLSSTLDPATLQHENLLPFKATVSHVPITFAVLASRQSWRRQRSVTSANARFASLSAASGAIRRYTKPYTCRLYTGLGPFLLARWTSGESSATWGKGYGEKFITSATYLVSSAAGVIWYDVICDIS